MADEKVLAIRRELLEQLHQMNQKSGSAFLVRQATEPDSTKWAREATYLRDNGWITGSIGPDGGLTIKLTSNGRDYVEAGGFWAPDEEVHLLSDR